MASWSYRVIRKNCLRTNIVNYQIHEVYYSEDGGIDCWTQNPVEPFGLSEAQLRNDVYAFLGAFRRPILEEKLVCGNLQLIEEKLERDFGQDLVRDYKNRASRASGYLFQMLGNHLLLKQDAELGAAYDKVDEALIHLWQAIELPSGASN